MEVLKTTWDCICGWFLRFVWAPIKQMDIIDIIDILALAVILYVLYRFFRTRRAGRVLIGLTAVVILSVLVLLLKLPALTYIVRLFSSALFFCVIVIFQPEIRDALESFGNLTFLNPTSNHLSRRRMAIARNLVDETVDAVYEMSASHTGGLIVFEGLTKLGDCIQTGKPLDASVTSKLIQNIFFDKAPLHDGALIIRNMRICAASCVLPATRGQMDFKNMGTRHRAAVGVTEISDALVVVISEQTGTVSVAQNGMLKTDVDKKSLQDALMLYIAGKTYTKQKRANMRKDYLQHLGEAGRVGPPKPTAQKNEAIDKAFERLFASHSAEETKTANADLQGSVEENQLKIELDDPNDTIV